MQALSGSIFRARAAAVNARYELISIKAGNVRLGELNSLRLSINLLQRCRSSFCQGPCP